MMTWLPSLVKEGVGGGCCRELAGRSRWRLLLYSARLLSGLAERWFQLLFSRFAPTSASSGPRADGRALILAC